MMVLGLTNFFAYLIPDIPEELKVQRRREIKRLNDELEEEEVQRREKELKASKTQTDHTDLGKLC